MPNDKRLVKCRQFAAIMSKIGATQRVLFAESYLNARMCVSNYSLAIMIGIVFYCFRISQNLILYSIIILRFITRFQKYFLRLYNFPWWHAIVCLILSFILHELEIVRLWSNMAFFTHEYWIFTHKKLITFNIFYLINYYSARH